MKLKAILSSCILAVLTACGGSGGSTTTTTDTCSQLDSDSFSCEAMLQSLQAEAVTTVGNVNTELAALSQEVTAYCDGGANQAAVGSQFKSLMSYVQQLEVMQFGPIAEFRDQLYVWPSNNTCRADDQMVKRINGQAEILSSARSLTAVEYMLFEEDTLASCAATFPSTVGNWKTTTNNQADRKIARCEYAEYLLEDLETGVTKLKADIEAYDLSSAFTTLQQAANSVSDGLFYIDKQTKDAKIKGALPQSASETFTLGKVESQFAHISKENILNNMLAAKALINAGLDDYLIAIGQDQLVTDILASISTVEANINVITPSTDLYSLVAAASSADISTCINISDYTLASSDLERFCALQVSVKSFTDLLKNDFVLALSFSTPATADGDND